MFTRKEIKSFYSDRDGSIIIEPSHIHKGRLDSSYPFIQDLNKWMKENSINPSFIVVDESCPRNLGLRGRFDKIEGKDNVYYCEKWDMTLTLDIK